MKSLASHERCRSGPARRKHPPILGDRRAPKQLEPDAAAGASAFRLCGSVSVPAARGEPGRDETAPEQEALGEPPRPIQDRERLSRHPMPCVQREEPESGQFL